MGKSYSLIPYSGREPSLGKTPSYQETEQEDIVEGESSWIHTYPDYIVFNGPAGRERKYYFKSALLDQRRITSDPYDLRLIDSMLYKLRGPAMRLTTDEAQLLGFALRSEDFRRKAITGGPKRGGMGSLEYWASKRSRPYGYTEDDYEEWKDTTRRGTAPFEEEFR